jgi:hypothetical protein
VNAFPEPFDIVTRLRALEMNAADEAAELIQRLTAERDEARRLLKAVVDMMRDNMAPDATHPKHVCDFIYCPEIAMCKVCENWTDALVMCYPDDFQDEEETK